MNFHAQGGVHTQAEPAFCGLGTLVMVLNALAIDPGRAWKGPWRWYAEEHLDCCRSLDEVARTGITLTQLACLARCNGARARGDVRRSLFARSVPRRRPRRDVEPRARRHVVVAYNRRTLGQTGQATSWPISRLHPERDLVLLLDVARFKYPPHWVALEALHGAMRWNRPPPPGRPRGYATIRRGKETAPIAALGSDASWAESSASFAISTART